MKLTVVELPVLYSVRYLPPGKGREVGGIARTWEPFEVPEVRSAEAPVAAIWTQSDSYERYAKDDETKARLFPDGPHVVTARVFEGRTYLRATGGKERFGIDDLARELRRETPRRHASYSIPKLPILAASRGVVDTDDPTRFRTEADLFESEVRNARRGRSVRKVSDDLAARRGETADAWRRGLLVVEGDVWSRTHGTEPYYRVCLNGQDKVVMDVVMNLELGYRSVPFRADRRADAVACGMDMARRTGRTFVQTKDAVAVPDPGLLTWDNAVTLASQVVAHLGSTTMNRADFEPWTEGMEASFARLLAVREVRDRDVAWAVEALDAYASFRDSITPELAANPGSHANGHVEYGAYAFHQWETVERALRPDMRADESAFAMGI